jgi:hypothetical protein
MLSLQLSLDEAISHSKPFQLLQERSVASWNKGDAFAARVLVSFQRQGGRFRPRVI